MSDRATLTFEDRFNDRESVQRALGRAVQAALLQHKRAGNPVAIWQDGAVRWLEPDEIPVQAEIEAELEEMRRPMPT